MFFLALEDREARDGLLQHLRHRGIHAVFHYVPLHSSPMGMRYGYRAGDLPVTESISDRLLRLPLYFGMQDAEQDEVISEIRKYFELR
jgi:dTDP-4-amino-4,6-dideoxygalactose transaminase